MGDEANTTNELPKNMDFPAALRLCMEGGQKVARMGWNGWKTGKSFAVVYQPGYPDGIGINANTSKALGLPEGTLVKFQPYLMLCITVAIEDETLPTAFDRSCLPWTPSQADQLANDWEVVA